MGQDPAEHGVRIALSGPTGSGKTTAARYLEGAFGFRHLAIGALVRGFVFALFGTEEKATLDRVTAAVTSIDPLVWQRFAIRESQKTSQPFVLDSVRFRRDAIALREAGFMIWRLEATEEVRRARLSRRDGTCPILAGHNPIEQELDGYDFDLIIENNFASTDPLFEAVSRAAQVLR